MHITFEILMQLAMVTKKDILLFLPCHPLPLHWQADPLYLISFDSL